MAGNPSEWLKSAYENLGGAEGPLGPLKTGIDKTKEAAEATKTAVKKAITPKKKVPQEERESMHWNDNNPKEVFKR